MELYAAKEFQNMMGVNDDVYSIKMCKIKLQEKYGSNIKFVGRQHRSDIILLNNTGIILTEDWYKDKKANLADETERIIKTVAKLIKIEIKNFEDITEYYSSVEDIDYSDKSFTPPLLKSFVAELVKKSSETNILITSIICRSKTKIYNAVTVWIGSSNR